MATRFRTIAEYEAASPPSLDEQRRFWDRWNSTYRFRDRLDEFMERQRDTAVSIAQSTGLHGARILDVGCGTGWLGNALLPFGQVFGTDLSEAAVAEGMRRYPRVRMVCGDFSKVELPGPYDFVVMVDSLTSMHEMSVGLRRVAMLLGQGRTFLLMTPNRWIWRRRSSLEPRGHGQFMAWPTAAEYKALLEPWFVVDRWSSIVPGGDRGLVWWVENRWVRRGMARLVGDRRWWRLLEALGLGRELVIVCTRNEKPA